MATLTPKAPQPVPQGTFCFGFGDVDVLLWFSPLPWDLELFQIWESPKIRGTSFWGSYHASSKCFIIWEFPKIRGTLFGGPYSKGPTI